jgi:hypothetical protein
VFHSKSAKSLSFKISDWFIIRKLQTENNKAISYMILLWNNNLAFGKLSHAPAALLCCYFWNLDGCRRFALIEMFRLQYNYTSSEPALKESIQKKLRKD